MMIARTIWMFSFAFAFVPLVGIAGDVAYRIDTHALLPIDESKLLSLEELKFQDRVWAAPGIEEASYELDPPQKCDFTLLASVRTKPAIDNTGRDFRGPTRVLCAYQTGPMWLDEVALPRTREMYGLGRSYDESEWDSRQQFTFGGITLQR